MSADKDGLEPSTWTVAQFLRPVDAALQFNLNGEQSLLLLSERETDAILSHLWRNLPERGRKSNVFLVHFSFMKAGPDDPDQVDVATCVPIQKQPETIISEKQIAR